ncbi:MAG: hypothetical protein A4E32_01668 [Methanomassiliicoccales archaeon PtaU1.Bin124]|nr:MAG: hypothetical protein A4E32_01668 [Methanomassiliicoccales archaeon PtaU1.Bin124]
MPFVEWSDKLSVGLPEIDDQHKELINILNRLHSAMVEGKGKVVLKDTLADLADYTVTHFYTEERYMTRYRYPQMGQHRLEHEAFVAKVKKFQEDFDAGNATITIELLRFIKEWLVNHISGTDMAMGHAISPMAAKAFSTAPRGDSAHSP